MRQLTKKDLLWDEKVASPYEIGLSIQSMKRRHPLTKIGLYVGVFDELTPADCVFLQLCRTECDIFIILIPTDLSLRATKTKRVKEFSTDERCFRLGSMVYSSFIAVYDEESPSLAIDKIHPDFIFYGRTQDDQEIYNSILKKDKLRLIEYPWREERKERKYFII